MNRKRDMGVPVGDGKFASPAACLLMAGFLAYEAPGGEADVHRLSCHIVDSVLSAAREAGFAKRDILETMMSLGDNSERIWALAEEATNAIGDSAAFIAVLRAAGMRWEGDQ
ncbi:hypothetical protein [Paraburkholderia caribensis]|uniref:hypothetical protein n=1 Tax=Paraburkholderia caribensis TaxID=75105 RepID=UPI001CAD929F|nr:hypothetical protein [Paraburkholderia caribensis]CAG9269364.1 conserved hypothetical protein [Paraburkholderia caribensis]